MNFYKKLAKYYDQIFPFNSDKQKFITSLLPQHAVSLLDTGCATGELLLFLEKNRKFKDQLNGLDLDPDLLKQAKKKLSADVKLFHKDMFTIDSVFPEKNFDFIFCLGNTLPHLHNITAIKLFLQKCYLLLKPKGSLVLQLVNYPKLLQHQKIINLPRIRKKNIVFKRNYELQADQKHIRFQGTVIDHDQPQEKNEISLSLVLKSSLHDLLLKTGFGTTSFYGNFKLEKYSQQSPALISISTKSDQTGSYFKKK
ncbi:MAG TPA: class I SAM-dependent methyltransferase [Spirochaetota bacterium]|nr:class I SAM-dependent methyltransferase [Spirochaetota bacterium]